MKSYSDYFYPGTFTLRNKLGITDPSALAVAEAELSRARMRELPPSIDLSPDSYRRLHHHIFQDVYPWAGEFRTVDLRKVTPTGRVDFAPGSHIAKIEMPRFFSELRHDFKEGNFSKLNPKTFGYRAAVYMADLNYIHPFPEGNGRTQRLLLAEIAKHAGYELKHERINAKNWMAASAESYGQDLYGIKGEVVQRGSHRKMTTCIQAAIRPTQMEDAARAPHPKADELMRSTAERTSANQSKDRGHER